MDHGLIIYGSDLKITQITEPDFKAKLDAFITANDGFNAARSARQTVSNLFKQADAALSDFLQTAKNVLAGRFGNRWSTEWAQAGFVNATTAIPSRITGRLALALSLNGFFTTNPSYEVPSMQVTAAQATALRNAALSAQQALAAAEIVLKDAGTTYDKAYAALADLMYTLIKILEGTLDDNDARWLAFGLQMPSTNATPGQPTGLTGHLDDSGNIIPQCDPTPLATRYRWRGLLVGIEKQYRLVASSTEPMASIPGVQPGQAIQIIVQAVNNGLQGVPSDPIVVTMPPVAKARPATAEAKAPATTETPAVVRTTGNGHGHENGQRRNARA